MKPIKVGSVLVIAVMIFSLFSCSFLDDTQTSSENMTTIEIQESVTQVNATVETTEETTTRRIITETLPIEMLMTVSDIYTIYADAANKVKSHMPAFTRISSQEVYDIEAKQDFFRIIERLLNQIVMSALKTQIESEDGILDIHYGDAQGILNYFPVFSADYGSNVQDISIISGAKCMKNGPNYEITMFFNDVVNAQPQESDFGRIMTPLKRDTLIKVIDDSIFISNKDLISFDVAYKSNYLKSTINIKTGEMVSLEQGMTMHIFVDAKVNILGIQSELFKGDGMVKSIYQYYDFVW